jgi:hypothetical protein
LEDSTWGIGTETAESDETAPASTLGVCGKVTGGGATVSGARKM